VILLCHRLFSIAEGKNPRNDSGKAKEEHAHTHVPLSCPRCMRPADCNVGPQPANCHLTRAQSWAFQVAFEIPVWIMMEWVHQARPSS